MVCGHQKGRDMKQKVQRNFGYARPEGYRKALRAMQMADKFGRPIIVFVDTPAAYPGVESEERGIAEAIALNLREMAILSVPIIVVITGEGGSGGALGLAIGDRVLMQEFAVYSVIPPEGCAAILWRDANRKIEAAEALKITAPDLIARGIVDGVVEEPLGGAHQDPDAAAASVDLAVSAALAEVAAFDAPTRLQMRYDRFRRLGALGDAIIDTAAPAGRAGAGGGLSRCPCERDAGSRSSGPIPRPGPPAPTSATVTRTSRRWPRRSTSRRSSPGCCASAASTRRRRRRASCRPSVDHLHDPFLLTDLGVAVERLLAAVANKERIAIHGDYDVDGVTSTVILRRMLELLGGDVTHFLPERLRDGYGLQPANVDRLHAAGARVIVSVDCGIRSGAAADRARELGIDLIITDHHEPEATLPRALAVINPKRPDCPYPDKHLAGVGVALKIVHGLCLKSGREKWLPSFLKIAAIGTIADVVPLVGENRVIARLGLERLSKDRHTVGLRALLDGSGLTGKALDSFHIGFLLAPRINAAGRMASPDIAARLLLASDEGAWDEARALAEQLNVENTKRQEEEASIVAEARKLVETDPDVGAHNVLVVAGEGWHRGVIGIVASKLVDHFHKPAIVLSIDGDEVQGSCRSISAFDMLGALEGCADLLGRYGGHRQAAGLSLERGRLADFRARVTGLANLRLEPDDLVPRLRVDAPLPLPSLIGEVVAGVEAMAPFGLANPRPVFEARDVEVVSGPHVLKDRHLSLHVKQGGRVFRAMAWRSAERAAFITEHRQALALAYSIDRNTWRGESTVELHVADLQAGTSSVPLPAAAVESAT